MLNKTLVVGICGGSGAGKTYLLNLLTKKLGPEACLLSQDHYYKPLEQQEKDRNGITNFDLPSAIDEARFSADLDRLTNGKSIQLGEYTFNNPRLRARTFHLKPARIIIVEGLFIFHFSSIRECLDLKIFIETEEASALKRRLERDQLERAYTEAMIRYQWKNHVKPAYERYLLPFRENADLIICNPEGSQLDLEPLLNLIGFNLNR